MHVTAIAHGLGTLSQADIVVLQRFLWDTLVDDDYQWLYEAAVTRKARFWREL